VIAMDYSGPVSGRPGALSAPAPPKARVRCASVLKKKLKTRCQKAKFLQALRQKVKKRVFFPPFAFFLQTSHFSFSTRPPRSLAGKGQCLTQKTH